MNINCELIAGGCNSVYNGLNLSSFENFKQYAAYPCSNQILIYNLQKIKVEASLSVFDKRVNSVKFYLKND